MRARCPDSTSRPSAPRSRARARLPWLLVFGLAAVAGCASYPDAKRASPHNAEPAADGAGHADKREDDQTATMGLHHRNEATARPGDSDAEHPPGPKADEERWTAEPGYPRVPESPGTDEARPSEAPRAVHLGDVTVAAEPPRVSFPAEVRVSVASLRAGKLGPRVSVLRQLSRALGKDSGVESVVALARLDAQAKDPADLADLARVALAQGAHLLLVEERADDASEPTLALVVHPASGAILACARGAGEKAAGAERAGTGKLAALIRSVR